ncbi:MAG: ThuA domain-containing protein, partial [Verrucomicrobiales bacterium]
MLRRFLILHALVLASVPIIPLTASEKLDRAKIAAAIPEKAFAEPKQARKILVFSVTRGFRHQSIPWGVAALEEMGKKTGAFTAVTSDDLANFEKDKLDAFDVVVFNNTTQNVFMPAKEEWEKMDEAARAEVKERELRLRANLLTFIRSGKGFVGIHAATDTFYEWPEFGFMIGAYFDGHPWNANVDVSIKV